MKKSIKKYLNNFNWKVFNENNDNLKLVIKYNLLNERLADNLQDLLNFADNIQNYHRTKNTDKTIDKITTESVYLCNKCSSNNISIWFKPKINNNGFCYDCQQETNIIKAELKSNQHIIGFQVIGIENTKYECEIHPYMDESFCIYSLSQARKMIKDDPDLWELLTIWNGDIENPKFMFNSDPRD